MAGLCRCYSWTCRRLWPLCIFLAAAPCFLLCSENPAAVVGKMYPRGNHWAVGHLMGKKSIKGQPVLQDANTGSNYLTPSQTASIFELVQHDQPVEVLQPKTRKQRLFQKLLHSSWREEDRAEYLQEMSNLILLVLKLQDNNSS